MFLQNNYERWFHNLCQVLVFFRAFFCFETIFGEIWKFFLTNQLATLGVFTFSVFYSSCCVLFSYFFNQVKDFCFHKKVFVKKLKSCSFTYDKIVHNVTRLHRDQTHFWQMGSRGFNSRPFSLSRGSSSENNDALVEHDQLEIQTEHDNDDVRLRNRSFPSNMDSFNRVSNQCKYSQSGHVLNLMDPSQNRNWDYRIGGPNLASGLDSDPFI